MASILPNPVGYLQEFSQKNVIDPPKYVDIASSGQDHCKTFQVECQFQNVKVIGTALAKKTAKTEAAKAMIIELEKIDFFKNFSQNSPKPKQALTHKSAISRLQEFCMRPSSGFVNPIYKDIYVKDGFTFECQVSEKITTGHSSTKKRAKEESALKMCIKLGIADASELDNYSEVSEDHSEDSTDCSFASGVSPTLPGHKNPITALQELCQSSRKAFPQYVDRGQKGGYFVMECTVEGVTSEGRDSNKKGAKTQAAHKCLKEVQQLLDIAYCPQSTPVNGLKNSKEPPVLFQHPIQKWKEEEKETKEETKREVIEKPTDFNTEEVKPSVQEQAVVDLPQSPLKESSENKGEAEEGKKEVIENKLQSKEEAKKEEVQEKEPTAICTDQPSFDDPAEEEAKRRKERLELINKHLCIESDSDDQSG